MLDSKSFDVDEDVIYNEANDGKRESDVTEAINHFDNVSNGNSITYVSRADWEGTDVTERPDWKDASEEIIEQIFFGVHKFKIYIISSDTMVRIYYNLVVCLHEIYTFSKS